MTVALHHGDCREVLAGMPADSVEACVTDPPYHLTSIVKRFGSETASPAKGGVYARSSAGFMGKSWDGGDIAQDPAMWAAVYRVLKPGAHLAAFGGTRTFHRMMCAIEDAGFEIRDTLMWVYGSGFPKSRDVGKEFDKAAGAKREVVGFDAEKAGRFARCLATQNPGWNQPWMKEPDAIERRGRITAPATDLARQWDGWGTALKPSFEPIVLARKPLAGTVAANIARYGTGALNIDATRIPTEDTLGGGDQSAGIKIKVEGWDRPWMHDSEAKAAHAERVNANVAKAEALGRFPANLLHDGSPEVLAAFAAAGESGRTGAQKSRCNDLGYRGNGRGAETTGHADTGTAARFFYTAKSSAVERNIGHVGDERSTHPTVKPLALMQWLCRLVTPPGGVILDPFCGSGSTLVAADREGFHGIGIEMDAEYLEIARRRFTGDCPLFADLR